MQAVCQHRAGVGGCSNTERRVGRPGVVSPAAAAACTDDGGRPKLGAASPPRQNVCSRGVVCAGHAAPCSTDAHQTVHGRGTFTLMGCPVSVFLCDIL